MKFTKLLTLFFLTLFIVSCNTDDGILGDRPDDGDGNSSAFSDNFGNTINRDFLGRVIDINNNPIEDVNITIGNITVQTDANGVFIINNATVFQRFAYIKADKAGYIHGSRAVAPSTGTNKVTIMLLEETVIQTLNSGETATVTLGNGASVSLDGNYKNPDGTDYTGSLDVIMHMLDPVDENMEQQMPGMLYAENLDGDERMLQTLGMLAVELRGDNGEDLNLADGSTSEIIIPLDASLVATAPATIPLWYFDEVNGYWKEEGQATLVGNQYVGTVTHFSFWNCDIPAEAINLCVTVTDENENSLANLTVNITSETFGTRGGVTNENGEVCGLVPSNETLTIEVLDFDTCGNNAIYTASIGPFTADSMEAITIANSTDIISETITGTFNDCDGNPVTDGYVVLTYGAQEFYDTVTDGTFEINMIRCSDENTFSIEAIDIDELQSSGEISFTFATPSTNLGTIQSCNTVDEFITYEIDGVSSIIIDNIFANFAESGSNWDLEIQSDFNNDGNCMWLVGNVNPAPFVGTYGLLEFNGLPGNTGFNFIEACPINAVDPASDSISFNLTNLGAVGEYIDINFSGTFDDATGSHTINGTIHVLRDN